MASFLKNHAMKLKLVALILMLVIPFLLYIAILQGSVLGLNLFLAIFIANMLFVMKYG